MDHIATGIEFQMSLLLFVSLAGYLLASRIGQPAVVDDVLAFLALSVMQQSVRGSFSLGVMILVFPEAIAFLAIGAAVGKRLPTPLMIRVDCTLMATKLPEVAFIFAMMAAFFYAMVAELIGLSAIVGAFIAGVSLEGANLNFSKDFKEGGEYLRIIFAAIFFVSLGILEQTQWQVSGKNRAAEILGLHRSTLRARMRKLGIVKP